MIYEYTCMKYTIEATLECVAVSERMPNVPLPWSTHSQTNVATYGSYILVYNDLSENVAPKIIPCMCMTRCACASVSLSTIIIFII